MWLLAPPTLGMAALWLWWRSRKWPRHLNAQGMILRDDRFVRWRDITRLQVVDLRFDDKILRLDLFFGNGQAVLPLANFENGEEAAHFIRAAYRQVKTRPQSAAIHPVIASPEIGQHLIADGAGHAGYIVNADLMPD
jgi:hypothetical protein